MGLIKAALGSLNGTLADQWKEFFTCDSMPSNVLLTRGVKQTSSRSSNKHGNDNVISNGSGIAVADGQCMIITDQGEIVEVCAEPGQFTYDTSSEPSIFTGSFGEGLKNTFKTIGKRFTYGGDTARDQRIYFINTKELLDNKFGTPNPIPFKVVDSKIGFDLDLSIRCSGVYSYRITDPLLFYKNVCGNVSEEYTRESIDTQLKTEFISALAPAMAKISQLEIRPSEIALHTEEIQQAMNEQLSNKWGELRGLEVVSVALNPVTLTEEDQQLLKEAQKTAIYTNANMAGAAIVTAQADAMRAAANNTNGAMAGFMGMGMAMNAGGVNAQNLYAMGAQQQQMQQQQMQQQQMPQQAAPTAAGWTCSCGATNSGKFCSNCGQPMPQPASWTCSCGTVNTGNFCPNCGGRKPQ